MQESFRSDHPIAYHELFLKGQLVEADLGAKSYVKMLKALAGNDEQDPELALTEGDVDGPQPVEDEVEAQLIAYESGVGGYAPIIDGEIAILKLRAEIEAETARKAAAIARLNALLVTQ